uniref:Chemocyanin n=1 Tax=Lilium longiflorum TaxID=4690 RepID=BABL_LILLO|nr:RecName: Full=Chemocyanin; AltName: Full=Basic blue protein; AltName: Full=Plantacyanin; Flags: Precursor [Lilium longiflorum]AAR84219.1 chemocyanin [Lilium longiflorum]
MAQGSGSAERALVLGVVLVFLVFNCEVAESVVYTVGDGGGWTFGTSGWPAGKTFRAGDVLVFKYNPAVHNVVSVPAGGYKSCTASPGSRVFKSGDDRITLSRGTNYFICSVPGHCQGGLKIAVTAA